MARIRLEGSKLKSWDDVNLHMKEIGELQLAIERIEAEMNEKIADVKLGAALRSRPHQERIKQLELEIKDFVEENRADIKGKTRVLDFGQVGFRKSTKIIVKSIKAVLDVLKVKGMRDCITVTETINKERLKEYPDDVIAAVGAAKKTEDVFWYEVDREKLADVS